jgi:hypothetical protein
MVRGDVHPLSEVKPVGREALHPRVEREQSTTVSASLVLEPCHHPPAMPASLVTRESDEIIHVQKASRDQVFEHAVAGRDDDEPVRFAQRKAVTSHPLPCDAPDQFLLVGEMRAQFAQDRPSTPNGFRCLGDQDVHCRDIVPYAGPFFGTAAPWVNGGSIRWDAGVGIGRSTIVGCT